jgi:putative resolvase
MKWLSSKEAKHFFGVHSNTLRNWDRLKKIQTRRTAGNHRQYNVTPFTMSKEEDRQDYIYARVSSRKQTADLERQVQFLLSKFPNHKIIRDVGSGINWKRQGLRTLLRLCQQGKVREVVVTYRDRMARLAFELIEFVINSSGGKLVVFNNKKTSNSTEKLSEDLLSIIHVFSCRSYGKRTYSKKKKS